MPADLPLARPPIRFEIPTAPRGKPRHHTRIVTTRAGRTFAHEYPDSAGERDEKGIVAFAAPFAPPEPWAGPVALTLTFCLGVPQGFPAWKREAALAGEIPPVVKPDVDNAAKLVMDALTRSGRWWADDNRIVQLEAVKVYAELPATLVEVRFLREPTREEWKDRKRLAGLGAVEQTLFQEPA